MPEFVSAVQNIAFLALVAGGGIVTLLYVFQRSLIYPASIPAGSRTSVAKPSDFSIHRWHDLTLTASDGVKVRAYLIWGSGASDDRKSRVDQALVQETSEDGLRWRAGADRMSTAPATDAKVAPYGDFSETTIVFFHANAGNVGHRLPIFAFLPRLLRPAPNVLMLSYRGYGLSEGTPSEDGIVRDADAAVEYVRGHPWLRESAVVVYGQSIGGAVALRTAARHPDVIRGVILENTFASLPTLVPHVLPLLRPLAGLLPSLLYDTWQSHAALTSIPASTPVLFLSGSRDELVPQSQMKTLWRAGLARSGKGEKGGSESEGTGAGAGAGGAAGEKKDPVQVWREFANGTHNDTLMQEGYFRELALFYHHHVHSLSSPPAPVYLAGSGYPRLVRLAQDGSVERWSDATDVEQVGVSVARR
ncbi:alpha/beta-hydrolase [Gonapodya prolifera JEL478]|uniref:Alpha/beta-hydrolase n=1 Tax=Gonapodya prolifera (strain JEL478) TaxID=1344416 RepID=A0A139AMK2_GONPJ|nr:alpha/beta-hydrolase [Gonapodya prolifera JEL478]|eukprot:KXS17753.1 alpha/beta-hydrolase [Gonapodya prolifera JEL478]